MKKIGIMIPCYNEQENIVQICNAVVKEITEELPQYDYEILIMDTDDIATAKKVWRWNKDGLGYSSTGYNGPFALAMTQDGQIVADFVLSLIHI